jgi:hypothetical protein
MDFSIKDLFKIHIMVRVFAIATFIMTPMWYFDLYLFKPGFVSRDEIETIPVVASFFMAIAWFTATMLTGFVTNDALRIAVQNREKEKQILYRLISQHFISVFSLFFGIIIQSVATYIGYIIGTTFIQFTFILLGTILIYVIFMSLGQKELRNRIERKNEEKLPETRTSHN